MLFRIPNFAIRNFRRALLEGEACSSRLEAAPEAKRSLLALREKMGEANGLLGQRIQSLYHPGWQADRADLDPAFLKRMFQALEVHETEIKTGLISPDADVLLEEKEISID